MADSIVMDGQVYPDELTAAAATHPNIPPELKQVFITGKQEQPQAAPEYPTDTFDTPLTSDQEKSYQAKFGPNDSRDYDMRGYFLAHPDVEPNAPGVHYPDTFKKPNHPTFSDESQYHGVEGNVGGTWSTENGKDVFTPSQTNIDNLGVQGLQDYFDKVEPNVRLNTPASTMALEASRKLAGASNSSAGTQDTIKEINDPIAPLSVPEPYSGFTQSPDIEDRRDEPNPNAVEWKNILPSLRQLAIGVGNQLWGRPRDPAIPGSEQRSDLSDALGREDIHIDPDVGRSPLSRAIEDVQLGANQLGLGRGESWADKLTNPTGFSEGTKLGNAASTVLSDKAYKTITAPLDVASHVKDLMEGKYPEWALDPATGEVHTNIQNIEKINDLAGAMVFGPAPVAGKMAEGTLGSFMGVKSQSFDKAALQKAQELEANGAHHEEIWNRTGTFRGADGRWRQEIPDQNVNILDKGTILNPATPDKGWTQIGSPETLSVKLAYSKPLPMDASIEDMMKFLTSKKNDIRLEHVLDHPELYQAYPWLKNIKVFPMPPGLNYAGMVKGNELFMNTATPENFTSTLMHEVQHLIQNHEGFATGANSNMFFSPELRDARSQFEKAKEEAINNSSKELLGGTTKDVVEKYKNLIGAYEEGSLDSKSSAIAKVKAIKEQHPEIYQRLSNVAKGEKLLQEAEDEAYEKYKNIMGEVESRNVQARLNMSNWQRTFQSPRASEEKIVPREKQINSTDIEHHVIGRK